MIYTLSIILFNLLLFYSCAPSPNDIPSHNKEVSISHLKSLCEGDHHLITEGYTVRGVVVANDWLGELHKSVIIIDETGGLEIAIESHNINNHLPIYSEVAIQCNGLVLARIGGKVELGLPPTGDFPLDNIGEEYLNRYIRIVGVCEDVTPKIKRFSEIGISDICNLVQFNNVRICDEEQGLSWCDIVDGQPITTIRTLVDREGNQFAIRTLSTCLYATEGVPTKEISVVGVIDYSDNRYFLRVVNKGVIQ